MIELKPTVDSWYVINGDRYVAVRAGQVCAFRDDFIYEEITEEAYFAATEENTQ